MQMNISFASSLHSVQAATSQRVIVDNVNVRLIMDSFQFIAIGEVSVIRGVVRGLHSALIGIENAIVFRSRV